MPLRSRLRFLGAWLDDGRYRGCGWASGKHERKWSLGGNRHWGEYLDAKFVDWQWSGSSNGHDSAVVKLSVDTVSPVGGKCC